MTDLACAKCGKRLSKKRARLIESKVLCGACVFPTMKRGLPIQPAKERKG